jgi:hypothetical protein
MNPTQTSPEFYVWESDYEYIDSVSPYGKYSVVRNGEMRYTYKNADGTEDILRYTTDLFGKDIKTDTQLEQAIEDGTIEVIDNPWFEVWNLKDDSEEFEVFFDLNEARSLAQKLYDSEKTNA